jgi:hypothetical protein
MIERGARIEYYEGKVILAMIKERKAVMDLYVITAWTCYPALRAALLAAAHPA